MGDKKIRFKGTLESLKTGKYIFKKSTQSLNSIQKDIGTGSKILKEIVPETSRNVPNNMDEPTLMAQNAAIKTVREIIASTTKCKSTIKKSHQ